MNDTQCPIEVLVLAVEPALIDIIDLESKNTIVSVS